MAGALGAEIEAVAKDLVRLGKVRVDIAEELLEKLRG